ASIITFLLVFFKFSFLTYQELTAVLVGLIVLLYGRSFKTTQGEVAKAWLLFLSTLSVQVLIISSGGFLSPFFILFHIFTLALAFYSLETSLTFLTLTLIDLSVF